MNRYILIRRLRGPAVLLLIGVVALLHESGLVDGWSLFFPLLLILIGVLKLAERAALAAAGDAAMHQGAPYPYGGQPGVPGQPGAVPPQAGTSIVPVATQEYGKGSEGGQS